MAEGGGGISGADAIGAAAGVAGMLPAFFGRGQNKVLARGFYGEPGYDKNAALFGGSKGGLQAYTNAQNANAQAADARDPFLANYSRANTWEQAQAQARQGQQTLAQAQMARALGQTPSIAQQQATLEMQQAAAAQGAQQASARGAAGLALAGQVAAGNTANAQSSIAGQAQINAANERMAAEGAAQNAFGNIRTGDATAQSNAAQQAQFQAQQQQDNRNANDQRALTHQQYGLQAGLGEMNARTSNQGSLAASNTGAQVANQKSADQNAGSKGLIQTLGDFFSDERTKTPLLLMGGAPRRPDEAMPMMGAGSGAAVPSYEVLNGSGGEDVAASGKAMSDFATKYATNPVAQPTMYSDERTKRPLLSKGIRPKNEGPREPAPKVEFDTVRGWHFPTPTNAEQAPVVDDGGADIDRQVAARRAQDAQERTDPAVGLDRIARDRSMIRQPGPVDANAIADQEKGVAPGTTDFDATQPKADPGPGKRPWWMALGDAGKSLNEAQFGRGPMLSDERTKQAVYETGKAHGREDFIDDLLAPKLGNDPSNTGSMTLAQKLAYANTVTPYAGLTSYIADKFRGQPESPVQKGAPPARPAVDSPAALATEPLDMGARLGDVQLGGHGRPDPIATSGDELADANRAMEGSAYAYKPAFTPPDQKPGEPNYGPMAQNMEKNPITATAVKTDPATGLKTIDRDKALKVTMAGLASLQHQNDNIMKVLSSGRKGAK